MTRYYAWKYTSAEGVELEFSTNYLGNWPPDDAVQEDLLYTVEAATWEEAMAIHHLRQGWEPYKPGPPATCSCGASFYPEGSGLCFRGHLSDASPST